MPPRSTMTTRTVAIVVLLACSLVLVGAGLGLGGVLFTGPKPGSEGARQAQNASAVGIHKIQHVVIIMQENRSFDNYFGTYPGADGIPMKNGVPTVCNPNPKDHKCIKPYHDRRDVNLGGIYESAVDANAEINGGKMDGFIRRLVGRTSPLYPGTPGCSDPFKPKCTGGQPPEVMGYHNGQDLPNYWAYARNFVLHDHMFEPASSYSLPSHLYMVSAWSAVCSQPNVASSCRTNANGPSGGPTVILPGAAGRKVTTPNYAWTDLTYLLTAHQVSWKYYVANQTGPYCSNHPANGATCVTTLQTSARGTPQLWNELPYFTTVQQDNQQGSIQTLDHFYADARSGRLPAVSWIVPNAVDSEHPAALVSTGQSYVTGLINALMTSPAWSSTAIFLAWDDWAGSTITWPRQRWTRMAMASACPAW